MDENGKVITDGEIPDSVMKKAKEMASDLPEGSAVGVMPIKLPLKTKIYVLNNRKAEDLCDQLCASIPGSDKITNILKEKYGEDDIHLPVDLSDGSFTTYDDNKYVNIFTVNQPCMTICNEDQNEFKLIPFCEKMEVEGGLEDNSESEFNNYVDTILVNGESIFQYFKDGTIAVFVFKSRMDKDIYATYLC